MKAMKEMLGTIIRIIMCIAIVLLAVFVCNTASMSVVVPVMIIAYAAWVFVLLFLEQIGL